MIRLLPLLAALLPRYASLAALSGVPVRINDPDCVRKTFPGYFAEFARIAAPAPAGGAG